METRIRDPLKAREILLVKLLFHFLFIKRKTTFCFYMELCVCVSVCVFVHICACIQVYSARPYFMSRVFEFSCTQDAIFMMNRPCKCVTFIYEAVVLCSSKVLPQMRRWIEPSAY